MEQKIIRIETEPTREDANLITAADSVCFQFKFREQ